MKTSGRIICFIMFFAVFLSAKALDSTEVYKKINDTTFKVFVLSKDDKQDATLFSGSAVAITSNLLATNCHVVNQDLSIQVKIKNNFLPAYKVYGDEKQDICLIFVPGVSFDAAQLRSVHTLEIGETVYALGSPGPYENVLTKGIVSGIAQDKDRWIIDTDAKINHGSSGGGLFDENGNLIGITTGAIEELPYAVAVDWINNILPNINVITQKLTNGAKGSESQKEININEKATLLGTYGKGNVQLYKKQYCFFAIQGKNAKDYVISRLYWFPNASHIMLFSANSADIDTIVSNFYILSKSDENDWDIQKTTSYLLIGKDIKPLVLIKNKSQIDYTLLTTLRKTPLNYFMSGNDIAAEFPKQNARGVASVKFDFNGFSEAYGQYLAVCNNNEHGF